MSHGVELPEIPRIFRDGVKRFWPGNRGLIPLLGIQVLVLTPGVRVQVPPRAPKASKSKDFGAFSFSKVPKFGKTVIKNLSPQTLRYYNKYLDYFSAHPDKVYGRNL